jgi:hypothetical protein
MMSLLMPDYIAGANVTGTPITFEWDDANPDKAYIKPDEALRNKIDTTSQRGVTALSLGFAEWIAWRFQHDNAHLTLLQLIEATWAGVIDWRYLSTDAPRLRWSEWQGPVRGPICAAFKLLRDIVRLTRTKQFASPESVCVSRLALHVLTRPEPFQDWRRFAMLRLAETDPRLQEDTLGKPIPRKALDPDIDYTREKGDDLLADFLGSLDYAANPYLASPENLKSAGFAGTPYSY